ncbi:photosystem II stability/assembly factor-like uncharacterized protein [Edaphobacter aggregans]|uniref:Photosystem II stability/assembly factor-like uncharacterized protein n=1 Tax=Edaphobacter aggregans TaxID=570835 RepID=A0A3R9P7C0_9BACT|nr:photosystem II stability/assembly factor-like uncharacterized protein [Edaphobacter aggregans]
MLLTTGCVRFMLKPSYGRTDMLNKRNRFKVSLLALILSLTCLRVKAADWLPFGPNGGDARAFAADPHDKMHLYMGTANGWIYETRNGGADWKRLARVGKRDDLVLDSIVVDAAAPGRILVGAWVLSSSDGGLYISDDAGVTWNASAELKGQSIRALASAPSDPKTVVAGTLKGVYRSTDGGIHWQLISPEGSRELHEVESIAIDPKDPQIIYAGTWHLPWKTSDGGAHWSNIGAKEGLIDDSDVFSIIVDPKDPNVVYASACSGIYKSENAAAMFHKIQGIPNTARRTRVLMQDPSNLNIVFAGTTEGLYRTADSGKTWVRMSGPELIVNDVYVNPTDSNRVMLATDRGGVLVSNDGGYSFQPSNNGFSARQITSSVGDARQPSTIYVGVVNDKAWGGVFVSDNGGLTWTQKSNGLEKHDVFSLGQASDGTVLAGTRHGIYRLTGEFWSKADQVSLALPVTSAAATAAPVKKPTTAGKKTGTAGKTATSSVGASRTTAKTVPAKVFDGTVFAFARDGDTMYAATSAGLLKSGTAGTSWTLANNPEGQEWYFVSAAKSLIFAANLRNAVVSSDGGQTWTPVKPPTELTQAAAVAVDGFGGLWIGGREGVYNSQDKGATWQSVKNLYVRDVNSLFYDERGERVLVTGNSSTTFVFSAHLPDKQVSYWNTGWNLRLVRPMGNHLVGATLFDGVVIQPEMVNSVDAAAH